MYIQIYMLKLCALWSDKTLKNQNLPKLNPTFKTTGDG